MNTLLIINHSVYGSSASLSSSVPLPSSVTTASSRRLIIPAAVKDFCCIRVESKTANYSLLSLTVRKPKLMFSKSFFSALPSAPDEYSGVLGLKDRF